MGRTICTMWGGPSHNPCSGRYVAVDVQLARLDLNGEVEAGGHADALPGLNLRAAFFVAQSVARRMISAGMCGSIIPMGSQMGHVCGPRRTLYCASKWRLEGLSIGLGG